MTSQQKQAFRSVVAVRKPSVFVHGDCIGADEQAHDIVHELFPSCEFEIFPTGNPVWRAFKTGTVVHDSMPALVRNSRIVSLSEMMVATPLEAEEMRYGGTWSTVRKAVEQKKPLHLILPDGTWTLIVSTK